MSEEEDAATATSSVEPQENESKSGAARSSAQEEELARRYLFQNPTTGEPSTAPLSTKQLCRILSPSPHATQFLRPESTLFLGFESSGQYSSEGWRLAAQLSVLREACSVWYYYSHSGGGVQGPVSCRVLSQLVRQHDGREPSSLLKLWSPLMQQAGEWKSLDELPNLQIALEAFADDDTPPVWNISNNNGSNESNEHAIQQSDTNTHDASIALNHSDMINQQAVEDLEVFLSSSGTGVDGPWKKKKTLAKEEEEEDYESDGGTPYVKDHRTGNWIHADLAPSRTTVQDEANNNKLTVLESVVPNNSGEKKRKKKPTFRAKNAKNWIYVTGFPSDTNEDEVALYFAKVGILDLDPETQKPRVKLYRYKKEGDTGNLGDLKGDGSICYARPESVELAIQILDESTFRAETKESPPFILSVQGAKFEQHGEQYKGNAQVSQAKRKVVRIAKLQAIGWDEGENGRITGGLKGLRIIVLKHMFSPSDFQSHDENNNNSSKNEDSVLEALEKMILLECEQWGTVEKITVFSNNPAGVVIVKFAQPTAASTAIEKYNGRLLSSSSSGRRTIEASFWDGVTNYSKLTADDEKDKETEKRLDEFGTWLEEQDLPEEFSLRVEK